MTSKNFLRSSCLERRNALSDSVKKTAEQSFTANAFSLLNKKTQTLGVYFPVKSELNVLPLAKKLQKTGVCIALPCVIEPNSPLVFKKVDSFDSLSIGAFHIPEPPKTAPVVIPDTILAPLTGFDRHGARLGYGAGYYDRTLAELENKPFFAGAAFCVQECDEIPCEKTDFPLDCIVTEKEIIWIK